MACRLSNEQVELLYKAVLGKIVTDKNNGVKHDPEQFMRDLYTQLYQRTNDQANAMDYVQHVPRMINAAKGSLEEIADYLYESGVSGDRIDKLRRDFKDIDKVSEFLGLNQNQELETAKELLDESFPKTGVLSTESYSQIENRDQDKKAIAYESEGFIAKPETGLALLNQEAQDYDGISPKQNVIDQDPKKKTYYAVVRGINEFIRKNGVQNADQAGIFLRAVPASAIPFEDLYVSQQKYLSQDDPAEVKNRKTAAEKMKLREQGDEIALVFTDKNGEPLYFNEEGDITSKKEGGRLVYSSVRRVYNNKGVKTIYSVQELEAMAKKPGAPSLEELSKARASQIDILEKMRERAVANPNDVLLFSVQAGRDGYVREDFSQKNRISDINLESGFSPIYSPIASDEMLKGGAYFFVQDYDLPVLIKRPTFAEIPNFPNMIADIMYSGKYTTKQKIDFLQQFTYSKDTAVSTKGDKIFVTQKEQVLDLSDPNNKAKFIENLGGQTVNINKDLLGGTFKDVYLDQNGEATLTDASLYNNFISKNFYTNLQKNAEGKIVKLNAYNVFTPTAETASKLFEVKPEAKPVETSLTQATPTDQSLDTLKEMLKNRKGLLKSVLLDSEATDEQIAQAEKWFKGSPLAKVVSFETLFNVVNSDALAEFTLAGITLYKGSNFTDLYHEGWHVFSQMFLTKDQKKALYNETRKLSGTFKTADGRTVKFNAATDIQLEEFLAEDFRKYVLSDGKTIITDRSTRNSIFKKILNFLKSLFKGQSYKSIVADQTAQGVIQDMYDKLWIGNINEYKPSLRNVQFTVLNKGAQTLDAKEDENKGLNYQDSMVLTQTIDSLLASTLSELGQSVGVVFTNPELMGPIYDSIKFKLSEIRKTTQNPVAQRIIDFALENWGDFRKVSSGEQKTGVLAFHKLKSSYIAFDEKYAEMLPSEQTEVEGEDSVDNIEDEALTQTETELRDSFGTNAFERKGNEASAVQLASNETVYLIKGLPAVDKKGNPQLNSLGVPKLVDFNRTWGIIINSVAGSINKTDMYNKLVEASKTFPELKELVNRLQSPMSKTDPAVDDAYIQMWGAFFRDFSLYRIPITEVQILQEYEQGAPTGNFTIRYTEADPVFQQVERNFLNAFQTAPAGKYISKTKEGANMLNLKAIVEAFPKGNLRAGNNGFYFLRAIGFNLTDNQLVKDNISKASKAVSFIYDAIKKLESQDAVVENPFKALETESGRVREIFNIEGKYSTNYSNNSIANVTGAREYDLSLNNSITQVVKELNDPSKATYDEVISQPHMAHLNIRNNPQAKYSYLLNSLFDLPLTYKEFNAMNEGRRRTITKGGAQINNTLNVVNFNGVKSISDEIGKIQTALGGIKTTSLDINSKFLMDMHAFLEAGVSELTRRASKSSAFAVTVTNIISNFNKNDKTSYISAGYFADPVLANNAAVSIFKEKIAAEMERIAIVKTGMFNNIPGFNEAGKHFTIFDDILSEDLKKKLEDAADAEDSYSVVNRPEYAQQLSEDIKNYLNNLYAENKALYDEMPFLSDQVKNKIRKLVKADTGLEKGLTDSQIEKIAVASFTVNNFIHNMEIIALLDGDLAMYNHLKDEYHKRNASITSTGRIFSTDPSDFAVISKLGRAYAKKLGVEDKGFDGQLNSVVFKDNKVKSAYYKEYLDALSKKYGEEKAKAILSPYEDMNEGDAQGWITFDAYRIMSMLEGNAWSTKQNELYNKIVNGEDVDPEEITQFFPPRKYQYAGPLKTDKLHIQAFHKFSLVPLIPSVIKGTNMEILHDNLVRQNVDYALFESGSKMATITKDGKPDKLYSEEDKEGRTIKQWVKGDPEYTKNTVFAQYMKNQVDIAPTWKNKTIFSTQLRKLIINDLFKRGLANSPYFNKLVEEFENTLNTLQNYKKQELLEEIGWVLNSKGEPTGDLTKLVKFVKKELTRQDLADHQIDFVDLNASNTSIKHDLSFSLNAEKIEKLLNAIVVKRLVRQKMNGEQLVQVSGAGFETRGKFRNATEEELLKYKGTNDLPTYRPGKGANGKTTAAKVKVALKGDYYKLLKVNHTDGKPIETIERLNEMVKDERWLNQEGHRKLITMVGVRIPVQGLNSMEFMEIYEFLPEEAGNIIIPPAEIVAKSGSDFDIDKLTIFQPNYAGNVDYAQYATGNNTKGTENKVIDTIREILEHPDNFDALIRPNDTDIVKGVADDLAEENIQGYNPYANKTRKETLKNNKGKRVISPTRTLEQRFNLYKHESNNIGKKTLGIGAVDNAYSSIFKRIGARLDPDYTFKVWDRKKGQWKKHNRKVHIAMDHNVVTEEGKQYISLSDIDTQTQDKISDLISQLMNGWVDIEKDAWIFNINGNNIAGPVLLFLLETGVDFRTAAYFVSQPIVIDYIKRRNRADSPFYEAATGSKNEGKGLNKFIIRKNMIASLFDVSEKDYMYMSQEKMYNNYIAPTTSRKNFTAKELLEGVKSKKLDSDLAKETLMHFFELEDMMKEITGIKLTMNVDTKPSKSFFAAQSKIADIKGLVNTDIMSQSLINKIKTNSPISSFFIHGFQLNVFKPLMKVRADQKVNEFLIDIIKQGSYQNTFDDPEKFVAAFKNDIPLYMLQNYIKGVDLDNLKEYNSVLVKKGLAVENVQLRNGAFVKGDVMYVDKDQIEKDFNSKAYSKPEYKQLGLYALPAAAFTSSSNDNVNLQEYTHFVLEREYQRSITPVKEGQSREDYEKEIAQKALTKTFNFWYMLKSDNSIAAEFSRLKKEPWTNDYMFFDQVIPAKNYGDKGFKTLKFKSSSLDVDLKNTLHENLLRLADPATIKVDDPKKNAEISRFFGRLIVSEYLRAGITKSSDSLAEILPTDVLMRLLEEPMQQLEKTGINDQMLQDFNTLFNSNWSLSKKATRNKYRNYVKPNEMYKVSSTQREDEKYAVIENEKGVNEFTNPTQISDVKNLLAANPEYVFVYPSNQSNVDDEMSRAYKSVGNATAVPVRPQSSKAWSDATYDDNIKSINDALNIIEDKIDAGAVIAFPKQGLTLIKAKETITNQEGKKVETTMFKENMKDQAPRTFDYLVTELYKRFGYVHPKAENMLGFRETVQEKQAISDKEVEEFMKKCFGK